MEVGVGEQRGVGEREFRRTHSLRSFRPTVVVTSIGEVNSDTGEPKRIGKGDGWERDWDLEYEVSESAGRLDWDLGLRMRVRGMSGIKNKRSTSPRNERSE